MPGASSLLSLFLLVTACLSASIPYNYVLHEKREYHPIHSRWAKRSRLPSDARMPVRVGLRQNNLEKGHDYLMDVSDPASPNYAKHWTSQEVANAFAPSKDTINAVFDWITSSGISPTRVAVSANKGWISFEATVQEAESLFQTQYHQYEHVTSKHKTYACEEYHVPRSVQAHVDYVTPGTGLSSPMRPLAKMAMPLANPLQAQLQFLGLGNRSLASLSNDLTICDRLTTPACVKALYQIPQATKSDPSNNLGVFEAAQGNMQSYNQNDLNLFYQTFASNIPSGTAPKLNSIMNAQAPSPPNLTLLEANLDFQVALPIVFPQQTQLYQLNPGPFSPFNDFLDAIDGSYCNSTAFGITGNTPQLDGTFPSPLFNGSLQCGIYKPTNVISVSFGGVEFAFPSAYEQRQCNEFMKLGLQGKTILFASGDSGTGTPTRSVAQGCLSTQGQPGAGGQIFNVGSPVDCPFITTVGASALNRGSSVQQPESAAVDAINTFSSGGGFSNVFATPSYQAKAVSNFLATGTKGIPSYKVGQSFGANGGRFNASGRGYPDVSAAGKRFATFLQGQFAGTVDGTSASTPVFAGVVNLINEERIAAGKKPVGFINPALYSNPGMLNDVTTGNNLACANNTVGFSAGPGWDPVTGLGTPNYPKMLQYFMSLP
ncbi:MAG: hypothetical protein M1820_006582 [Bogoriella megaspora]|nr:MAG: hypothetical protein M1820_006582 [Bogoriella megaspora]